jgi:hypothetical protein
MGHRMKSCIWSGAAAGALAGALGSLAMNQFQRIAAKAGGGLEARGATMGIPRTGRGPQPAQALGNASDDATAKVANTVTSLVGRPLTDPRSRQVAGEFVHVAFGALNGALYGAAVELNPRLRRGAGVPFGIAVWLLADEGLIPALGLSRSPRETSAEVHTYSVTAHAIYGATTELVRRALRGR